VASAKSPSRQLFERAVFSAAVTLTFFVGAELGLTVGNIGASELYDGDPGFYWTLHSNLELDQVKHVEEDQTFPVRTSPAGLRDAAWPEQGPTVLALGCSTTFGWGVAAEEAWPEQLQERLGVPVINGGVPGHSSHQGRRFATDWLARSPTVVILGWGVRDVQMAPAADRDARPARFPRTTRLYRSLRKLYTPSPPAQRMHRVAPEDFAANVRAVADAAAQSGSRVLLLDFPSQSPSPAHRQALRALSRELGLMLISPSLTEDAFFDNDAIHLNPSGNKRLAELLEVPVRAAITQAL